MRENTGPGTAEDGVAEGADDPKPTAPGTAFSV